MDQPGKQEELSMKMKTSVFQPTPREVKKDKEHYTVSTARKSSIEAKGMCAVCGVRVNRDDLEACSHCGSLICSECKRLAKKRGRRLASDRNG